LNRYELVVFFVCVALNQVYGPGNNQAKPIFKNDGFGDLEAHTQGGSDQDFGLQPKERDLGTDR
jgi:hypothetical protein